VRPLEASRVSSDSDQCDGFLRTSRDAQAAGVTGGAVLGERLVPSVDIAFHLSAQRKTAALLWGNRDHAEHVIRTHLHAFFLAFATIAIDDRRENARGLLALRTRLIHG